MTRIVVLVNLKPGKDRADYEAWARSKDLPTVNALPSVDDFSLFESVSLLGSDGKPPYDYVETIDINDMDAFRNDVSTETMGKIAAEFQDWADTVFIVTRTVERAA